MNLSIIGINKGTIKCGNYNSYSKLLQRLIQLNPKINVDHLSALEYDFNYGELIDYIVSHEKDSKAVVSIVLTNNLVINFYKHK